VSLDYLRLELGLQYTATANWDLIIRMPWEQKAQSSGIALVDPATPAEEAAMLRNMNVHHRDETYRGFGDAMLLARRRWRNLSVTFGTSVPTGRTEENPYLLGEQGVEHLHIQFGSGTFDPLLEAAYTKSVTPSTALGAYASARIPLYENARTFRAPADISAGVNASRALTQRVTGRVEAGVYYQGYGEWDDVRDENTGVFATTALAGVTLHLDRVAVSADLRVPLTTRTLTEGDAFRQGPTVVVTLSGLLR
jgi:hypothetical protein